VEESAGPATRKKRKGSGETFRHSARKASGAKSRSQELRAHKKKNSGYCRPSPGTEKEDSSPLRVRQGTSTEAKRTRNHTDF